MATLVRYRHDLEDDLQSTVPSPFSAQLLRDLQDDTLDELAAEPVDYDDTNTPPVGPTPPQRSSSNSPFLSGCTAPGRHPDIRGSSSAFLLDDSRQYSFPCLPPGYQCTPWRL